MLELLYFGSSQLARWGRSRRPHVHACTAVPHSLHTGQPGMWVLQSLCLGIGLGLGRPTCACSSAALPLYFLWTRQSCVWVPQYLIAPHSF